MHSGGKWICRPVTELSPEVGGLESEALDLQVAIVPATLGVMLLPPRLALQAFMNKHFQKSLIPNSLPFRNLARFGQIVCGQAQSDLHTARAAQSGH